MAFLIGRELDNMKTDASALDAEMMKGVPVCPKCGATWPDCTPMMNLYIYKNNEWICDKCDEVFIPQQQEATNGKA